MRRNGGIIGPLQEPSAENAGDVKIFDNHDRHIRGSASWPDIAGITGISQTAPNNGSTNLLQNDVTTFTVTGTGHQAGAVTYYWILSLGDTNSGCFNGVSGSFSMGTNNSGTFTIETNFTADPYFVTAADPKTFTIYIRADDVYTGPTMLISGTFSIVNFTIPSTFEGFKAAALDEGAGVDGTTPNSPYMQFKMENVGSAGSSAGAIRFLYPNFLEFTSSSGIQLCGGVGTSGTTERYQAQSTNSTAGSTGEMIFTVRGVTNMSVWYQFKSNDDASSQARLYADSGAGWSQLATSNSTSSVTGTAYGLHDGDRLKFEFYNDGGGFGDGRGEITGLYGYGYGSSVYAGVASMSTSNSAGVADVYKISVNNGSTYNYTSVFNGSGYSDVIAVDPDYFTEGVQYARVQIAMYGQCKARQSAGAVSGRNCWTQVSADQATINDTSKTANISSNTPFTVTEGSSTTLQITNTGQSAAGELFYTCTGTGVTNADFATFTTTGTITMNTQSGTQQYGTITIDPIAEGGTAENESFQVQIRKSSTSGTILHTTNSITITDATPTTKSLIMGWMEHRYGSYIGTLNVYLVDASTGGQTYQSSSLYSSTGQTGSAWAARTTTAINATAGSNYRYLFYYVCGISWAADWAIDNVNVVKDGVQQWFDGFESSPTDWYTGPAGQSNTTTVAQAWSGKSLLGGSPAFYTGKWFRHSGSTGSSGTGPSGAYSGTYYAYAETTGSTWPRRFYLWTPSFLV